MKNPTDPHRQLAEALALIEVAYDGLHDLYGQIGEDAEIDLCEKLAIIGDAIKAAREAHEQLRRPHRLVTVVSTGWTGR